MLIATSTDTIASISVVSGSVFTAFSPFLYLIIGLVLAFYIGKRLIDFLYFKNDDSVKETLERGNRISERIKKYE